jgi:hypothetical protein
MVALGCGASKQGASRGAYSVAKASGGGGGYYPESEEVYAAAVYAPAPMEAGSADYAMDEYTIMAEGKKDQFEDVDGFPEPEPAPIYAAEKPVPAGPKGGTEASGEPGGSPSDLPDEVVEGRVIIYEGRIVLAVYQVQEELENIRKEIKGWGGYMLNMNSNSVTFRVPVEKFDEIMDTISGMGELISKDITGQDVTDEFRDLTIKLNNAMAMRDRLIELLGKAHTVKESLLIEAELKRLLEEIELIKGRLKFLKESALYSRITVYLESKETYKKPIPKLPAPLQWIQYELGLNPLFEQ